MLIQTKAFLKYLPLAKLQELAEAAATVATYCANLAEEGKFGAENVPGMNKNFSMMDVNDSGVSIPYSNAPSLYEYGGKISVAPMAYEVAKHELYEVQWCYMAGQDGLGALKSKVMLNLAMANAVIDNNFTGKIFTFKKIYEYDDGAKERARRLKNNTSSKVAEVSRITEELLMLADAAIWYAATKDELFPEHDGFEEMKNSIESYMESLFGGVIYNNIEQCEGYDVDLVD